MTHDDIAHAARLLMAQYGDDGAVIAIMRAAEAAAIGDIELSDHWEGVSTVIENADKRRPDA
jgi:CobQ-like glutamine amidotransferase family enzyme